MFTRKKIATSISTLFVLFVLGNCADETKFNYCAVNGRGSFKRVSKYCPILEKPASQVQCVTGIDRLDCLRKLSKQQVDFAVFTSEDLITASNSAVNVLITNELRFNQGKYEYEVVAVFDKKSNIKSRHDLQDKKFCHPGYGYESEWTTILSNYLEASIVPQKCQPELTLTENKIKASSEFFSMACKSGPWVENSTLDYELKNKYPNLCQSCDHPARCSKEDKYWGRRGSLFCLTDGAGDISWARWDDVQMHFGMVGEAPEASVKDYGLLCPDDSVMSVNVTKPCVWVVKPWSVVATVRNKAQKIQELISSLSHEDNASWQSALLNLMESYHVTMSPVVPIEPVHNYLTKATGFLSANSFPGCHPPRTVTMCTTSVAANAKCSWLREAMASYGIEPGLECLMAEDVVHCMDAVRTGYADVLVVAPDYLKMAQSEYFLKVLFYETVNDYSKYLTVALTNKATSSFETIGDLKGSRACFPTYNGVAWNSVANYLNEKGLLDSCPLMQGMEDFFGDSCVPGVPDPTTSLGSNCRNNSYEGEYGAIRCLLEGAGDVAFVSQNSLKNYLADKRKNMEAKDVSDFKKICKDAASKNCLLSWAPSGYVMVRENVTELRSRDLKDVFFALDENFGKTYRTLTASFTLFGSFNGVNDLIFHDATVKIRTQPTLRNTESKDGEYSEMLENVDCEASGGVRRLSSVGMLMIPFVVSFVMFLV